MPLILLILARQQGDALGHFIGTVILIAVIYGLGFVYYLLKTLFSKAKDRIKSHRSVHAYKEPYETNDTGSGQSSNPESSEEIPTTDKDWSFG